MCKNMYTNQAFFGLVIAIKTIFKVNGIPRTINYKINNFTINS